MLLPVKKKRFLWGRITSGESEPSVLAVFDHDQIAIVVTMHFETTPARNLGLRDSNICGASRRQR